MATNKQTIEFIDNTLAEYEEARTHYMEQRRSAPTFSVRATQKLNAINLVIEELNKVKAFISDK